MTDLGKLLIVFGAVLVVAGLVLIGAGPNESSAWAFAWRYRLSREEYDGFLSADDFGAAERSAVDCSLRNRKMEKVSRA